MTTPLSRLSPNDCDIDDDCDCDSDDVLSTATASDCDDSDDVPTKNALSPKQSLFENSTTTTMSPDNADNDDTTMLF